MMVKKIATACLCMALGSSLYAKNMSEDNVFIGLELESTKLDTSIKLDVNDFYLGQFDETSDSMTEYGLRIGAENEEWRATLLYTYADNKDAGVKETTNKGSLLLDYFFWSSGGLDYEIKPYLGLHVGYMNYEVTTDLGLGINRRIVDSSGMFYGAQLGVALNVSEVVGFDISYKYSVTSIEDDELIINGSGDSLAYESSLDNMGTIAFSVNYFF